MLSIYALKPGFQRLLQPLVSSLAARDVQPNTVTLAAIALSCAGGLCVLLYPAAGWPLLLLAVLLLVRMALNAIDGQLARQCRRETPLGLQLNELGDVLSDCAMYLPLALVPGLNAVGVVLLCVLSVAAEMAGVLAVQTTGRRSYAGPMGKSDRATLVGLLCLLIGSGVQPALWSDAVLALGNLLLIITIVNRSKLNGR
jgi:CDP-diacylglycerol--glycerol-3-phosphate 3-phosphatidyltransferase